MPSHVCALRRASGADAVHSSACQCTAALEDLLTTKIGWYDVLTSYPQLLVRRRRTAMPAASAVLQQRLLAGAGVGAWRAVRYATGPLAAQRSALSGAVETAAADRPWLGPAVTAEATARVLEASPRAQRLSALVDDIGHAFAVDAHTAHSVFQRLVQVEVLQGQLLSHWRAQLCAAYAFAASDAPLSQPPARHWWRCVRHAQALQPLAPARA